MIGHGFTSHLYVPSTEGPTSEYHKRPLAVLLKAKDLLLSMIITTLFYRWLYKPIFK